MQGSADVVLKDQDLKDQDFCSTIWLQHPGETHKSYTVKSRSSAARDIVRTTVLVDRAQQFRTALKEHCIRILSIEDELVNGECHQHVPYQM